MYVPGEGQMMVRWSGEVQLTVRLGSYLKSILSFTLVDVKLVFLADDLLSGKLLSSVP